jgi:predicted TPR repeat methyltransferase
LSVLEAQVENCQCQGLEAETEKWALKNLALYREGKPAKTTPMLVKALLDAGVDGLSLLDIGGGIGAVQLGLLRGGATAATSVEASKAYLKVAQQEAARAAMDHRITYIHGDFVSLASVIPEADIVTLDRVICCYGDVQALVSLSASKARKLYALVYPRSTWWVRIPLFFENLGYRLRGSPFRAFVHSSQSVDRLLRNAGLKELYHQDTFAWQVVLYQR